MHVIDNFLWSQKRGSTYFDIPTKSKYVYVSDIALQCMYIQSNACISLNACIFNADTVQYLVLKN